MAMGVILAVMGRVRCRVAAKSVSLAAVCQNAALIAQAIFSTQVEQVAVKKVANLVAQSRASGY